MAPGVAGGVALCVYEYTAPPSAAEKEKAAGEGATALADVAEVTT